jgi:glycosyltransferase involved in cell wall biosynthesis
MSATIMLAANRGFAIHGSRRPLIAALLRAQHRVVLATADDEYSRRLTGPGVTIEPITFMRGARSPIADIRSLQSLRAAIHRSCPDLIHNFHAKPVLFCTAAARSLPGKAGVAAIVNTITGLGHAFVRRGLLSHGIARAYALALRRAHMTVFQNHDDHREFVERGIVPPERACVIVGSGVDLHRFASVDRSGRDGSAPTVVMLARLLGAKGIREFVEVAGIVTKRIPEARFVVAGEEEPSHPDAIDVGWLRAQGAVEYEGRLDDVRGLLGSADLMLMPTYREGVPRVILEAAATGLPCVAFDVPGVREAIRSGRTGELVPFGDVQALADRTIALLEGKEERERMGAAARAFVEQEHDVESVTRRYLQIYRTAGVKAT